MFTPGVSMASKGDSLGEKIGWICLKSSYVGMVSIL